MALTKAERYIAFLLTYLPKLSAVSLFTRDAAIPHRGGPLHAAQKLAAARAGVCLEFGVFKGASISASGRKYPKRRFYGFDSFEGFPDDKRIDWTQDFSVQKLPAVPANVTLIKGWFGETLPPFLARLDEPIAMVHVDCDIYSSTVDVFTSLRDHGHFKPGLVIAFDELINYRDYLWNEMLALFEALEETGLGIEWIACHKHVRPVDETLSHLMARRHPAWKDDVEAGYWQQASAVLTSTSLDLSTLHFPHVKAKAEALARDLDALTAARSIMQAKVA